MPRCVLLVATISHGICDAAITTLVAADLEGYSWTGIEMTNHHYEVARQRVCAL